MPSESELRDRFHEGTQPSGQIDVDAVLRRARARRRPRVILAAAGSVLAIAAIAVPATFSSFATTASDSPLVADGSATGGEAETDDASGAGEAAIAQAPAEELNLCGSALAEVSPAASGLVITVEPVAAAASDAAIPVTVTLTNTGSEPVSGTTGGRPALTLSRDGITLWHSDGPQTMIGVVIDLAPGESVRYESTFEPVVCAAEDELEAGFRPVLPEAGPGSYDLSAAIDFVPEDGSATELVTGPAVEVVLH